MKEKENSSLLEETPTIEELTQGLPTIDDLLKEVPEMDLTDIGTIDFDGLPVIDFSVLDGLEIPDLTLEVPDIEIDVPAFDFEIDDI